jgi:hypothetical protein
MFSQDISHIYSNFAIEYQAFFASTAKIDKRMLKRDLSTPVH